MTTDGQLFVVSAPSGTGKNTLLERALERRPGLEQCITATTRAPRPGEVDGIDYYFMSEEEFLARRGRGEFVEWARVHGRLYGVLRQELCKRLANGGKCLLQVDIQGRRNLEKQGIEFVSVFVAPPSFEELERRLRQRGSDSDEQVRLRLETAHTEMNSASEYDYVVVNDDIDRAVAEFLAIVDGHGQPAGSDEQEA